ncbi:aprataxin and PNK-like factor isoform 2-T3 [Odontesthes bonariensis]|uniref:aprataxin and PNK-like factor isoform X2 n=1 Tax=Odontesthes bonariensis TaxID=219752 RepID=UPI003F58255C
MSGFDLVPVDGGDPVHLPPGETFLGRGPLLGISDMRVSRRHGLLENLNGQLRLKPTHQNPCFLQASLTDDPRPLPKDRWQQLHHGELLSLLPGRLVYRVEASVGREERAPRNCHEEDGAPPPVGQKLSEAPPPFGQKPPEAPSNEEKSESPGRTFREDDVLEDLQSDVAPIRRRILPAWMMAAASKSPSFTLKAVKRSKRPAAAAQATPTASSSREEAELSEEEEEEKRPRKRRRKISDEEEKAQTKTVVPSDESTVRHQSKPSRSELSHESDSLDVELEMEGKGGVTQTSEISETEEEEEEEEEEDRKSTSKPTAKRAESEGSNGHSATVSAASKPRARTPCPYGKDCYRKNPLHFQECSHPGDTDHEEEEEEEADRPECPYGTDCYRKNPLHRKEYKHSKKPARSTRTVSRNSPDEDEDDEDEDDDSFINDDSEDVGEDSDYVPPASDDSDREDVTSLQREAKAFLKKRK